MKSLLTILSVTLLIASCGKKSTTIVENAYNDSSIKAYQVIQDARIAALEARLNAYQTQFDTVVIDYDSRLNNLDAEFTTLDATLNYNIALVTSMLADLNSKQIEPVKICASNEYLLKTATGMYAVYMVSNNYGTFLGKLSEQTNYQTTDVIHAQFKIVNNNIVCL